MSKVVTYFSASGKTAKKALDLAQLIGADLYEIAPAVPYTRADLNWMDKKSRSTLEMQNPASRPALADTEHDFSAYNDIYIGFPIWWYTAPTIINTFLETYDFSGKRIILFATSGGSSIEKSVKDLSAKYPGLNIVKGKLLNGRVRSDII